MSEIVFLAPDTSMYTIAKKLLQPEYADIKLAQGLLSEGVTLATKLIAEGAEIIISRGGTAAALRNANLAVTIVEVPITGFDIIRAVQNAQQYGHIIGAVSFPSILQGMSSLSPAFGVDIRLYPLQSELAAEAQVLQAIHDGAQVLLGGYITARAAQKHSYPHVLIETGSEGIIQAVLEAKRIAHARSLEKIKTGLFQAVLNYAYEGFILVDKNCRINFINPVAERILHTNNNDVIGQHISRIWPGLNLQQVINTKQDDLSQIQKLANTDVLCNKVAITVNHKPAGAVVSFQDITRIQQTEAQLRRRIYDTGLSAQFSFADIIGVSPLLQQTIAMAKAFALTASAVLILGETGTGKEVFAQSIHNYSDRRCGPFVAVNCAALPNQILESELFGYVGGAFTGANPKGKPGLFELAHGGSIFLDEISELEYPLQSKLLRVIQEKKVMRLGSDNLIPVDVRIITAANKNIKRLVTDNKFRSDLYYRINVLQLRLSPLRRRPEDIPLLAQFFLQTHAGVTQRIPKLLPSAIEALTSYPWPGNIRELQNCMERLLAVCRQASIDIRDVQFLLQEDDDDGVTPALGLPSEAHELQTALALANGRYAAAARILGISRSTLWRRLKRLGLK